MPPELAEACAKHPHADALRIWTTSLCAATLMGLEESWLVSSEGDPDETIVDRAFAWLGTQGALSPEIAQVLPGVRAKAQATAEFWKLHQLLATQEVRKVGREGRFRSTNETLRLMGAHSPAL